MYQTSVNFNKMIKKKSRKYFWTGEILLKTGKIIKFDDKHILKDSGYISNSCSGSNEIELGSVYAAEIGITLKLDELKEITLEGSIIKLYFNLVLGNNETEKIPLGIFETTEANRTKKFVEIKGYDFMVKFNKTLSFKETSGTIYELLEFCCKKCSVELGISKEEIEKLPNGVERVGIYAEHDIETYRDLIHYISAATASFATIDRFGKLILKRFNTNSNYEIKEIDRYELSISDFTTRYTAVQSTNLKTKISEYYSKENDNALTMNIGVNPLMQLGLPEKRVRMCKAILEEVATFDYTPLDTVVVSNPAFEVGDMITFKVGVESYHTIVTSIEYKIHGKYRIKSVGKNALLSKGKSKQDKNIQGILQTIESDRVKVNAYVNGTEIKIGQNSQTIIDIEFASSKETDAFFIATVLFDVKSLKKHIEETVTLKDEKEEKKLTLIREVEEAKKLNIIYSLNEVTIRNHAPKFIAKVGSQMVTLFYPLINLKEKVINRFTVDFELEKGSLVIPIEGISAAIIGSALGGDVPWDGKIKVNENLGKLTLSHRKQVDLSEGSIEVETYDVPKYEFSDVIIKNDLNRKFVFGNIEENVEVEEKNER